MPLDYAISLHLQKSILLHKFENKYNIMVTNMLQAKIIV